MGRFGYGVVSYFSLIWNFLVIFALIMIVHLPILNNYAEWEAYKDRKVSFFVYFSIGNLGQSIARCANVKMFANIVPIGCDTGLISKITHVGINSFESEAEDKGLCSY